MSRKISRKIKSKLIGPNLVRYQPTVNNSSRAANMERARLYLQTTYASAIYEEIADNGAILTGVLAGPICRKSKRK